MIAFIYGVDMKGAFDAAQAAAALKTGPIAPVLDHSVAIWMTVGAPAVYLVERLGHRRQAISGGLIVALGILPVALLVPALAVSVRTLVEKWRARSDLSMAIANSGPDQASKLQALVQANDLPGVVEVIRSHLGALPPKERVQAEGALSQPSEVGRRSYAQSVLALGLHQVAE